MVMDSVGNAQDTVRPSGPIVVIGWVQNSVNSRKRQDQEDSVCMEIQQRNQNAALLVIELKMTLI